jgi:hypothetical protein
MHLFSGSYRAVGGDCLAPVPFAVEFGLALTYNVGIYVPLFAMVGIMRLMEPAEESDDDRRARLERNAVLDIRYQRSACFYANRLKRCFWVWLSFVYLPVTSMAVEAVACLPGGAGGHYFMVVRPNEQCFVGDNLIVAITAGVLILALTISFPIAMFCFLRKKKSALLARTDPAFHEQYSFFFEFFNGRNITTWIIDYPVFITIAMTNSILRPFVFYQMGISGFFLLGKITIVIAVRPYIDWVTDVIQVVLAFLNLVALNLVFFQGLGVFDTVPDTEEIFLAVLFGLIGLGIFGAIGIVSVKLFSQPPELDPDAMASSQNSDSKSDFDMEGITFNMDLGETAEFDDNAGGSESIWDMFVNMIFGKSSPPPPADPAGGASGWQAGGGVPTATGQQQQPPALHSAPGGTAASAV